MIQNTPEGNQTLYRLMPVELAIQFVALGFVAYHYIGEISHNNDVLWFGGAIAALNVARFLSVIYAKYFLIPSAEGHGTRANAVFISGNLLTGISWGGAIVMLSMDSPSISLADNVIIATMAGLIMASLAGSGMWSWLFFAFAAPASLLPLGYAALLQSKEQSLIWGLLFTSSVLNFWAIKRAESSFHRYRQLGRQNTQLVKELAAAKEHAVSDSQALEKAHENLKSEYAERQLAEERIRASEREMSRILQDMQDTYFQVDGNGHIKRLSPSAQLLLGHSPEILINQRFFSLFVHQDEYRALLKELDSQGGSIQNFEARLKHSMGTSIWASFNAHNSSGNFDRSKGFEGTIRDVTESKKSKEELFQEKERLHVTLESIGDGVISTDISGQVEYLNPIAEHMTGCKEHYALGKSFQDIMRIVDENNRRPVVIPIKKWLQQGRRVQLSTPVVLINREKEKEYTVELSGSPLRDSKGVVIGTVFVFHNVTKLRTLTRQLSYQASHDALTGLINRREFEQRVNHAIQSAHHDEKHHALLYIDLDQFKVVNDTCGHHAGDKLLKQITTRIKALLRESDTLARLGGDEFGVLLIGCPMERAQQVAEKIRADVEQYRFAWEERVFRVGTSIGLVSISEKTQSLTELLSAADSACYVSKERGRNQVHVYTPDDKAIAHQHGQMQWLPRIQRALEKNLFVLHVQSMAPVKKQPQQKLSAEILVRMRDEKNAHNLISPGAFIPSAERYQLMPRIDQWIIKHSLRALASSKLALESWEFCSINLSGQSISDGKMLELILEELKKTGVPPSILCFEITESAVIANLDNAHQFISTLKSMGCRFALDDFGTGLSSFAYLKSLPVDFLKLDGELVKDIANDKAGYAMVEAINKVAHVMNMQTIAEHVESIDTLKALQAIAVDYAQGYAIDMPKAFEGSLDTGLKAG